MPSLMGFTVVQDFIALIANHPLARRCYRGQQDVEWPLMPSVFREGACGIDNQDKLYLWQRQAARFADPMPITTIDWLILAQHYGIATPLLDWTASPLIALFFACGGGGEVTSADGCVWMAREQQFAFIPDTLMLPPFGKLDGPYLIDAVGRNARSTAQDSLLSLHSENDVQSVPGNRIFNVPGYKKLSTLTVLSVLGITDERLHADIGKLVFHFKRGLEHDRFFEDLMRQAAVHAENAEPDPEIGDLSA